MNSPSKEIDQYIAGFPADTQTKLNALRAYIHTRIPGATEAMSYGIPTFKLKGKNMVHFAAYKQHIGFYPGAKTIEKFSPAFAGYKWSKGAVQLPLQLEIPWKLLDEMISFRLELVK